jgi:hypothetical protein
VPSFCVEKVMLVALNVASGSITVAVSGTVCGLPAAVSVMVSVAVEAVGLKMSAMASKLKEIVQLFFAANEPVQPLVTL